MSMHKQCVLGLLSGEGPGDEAMFAHAQFPKDFWEFGNFYKICFVTLATSARQANFSCIKDAFHGPHSV